MQTPIISEYGAVIHKYTKYITDGELYHNHYCTWFVLTKIMDMYTTPEKFKDIPTCTIYGIDYYHIGDVFKIMGSMVDSECTNKAFYKSTKEAYYLKELSILNTELLSLGYVKKSNLRQLFGRTVCSVKWDIRVGKLGYYKIEDVISRINYLLEYGHIGFNRFGLENLFVSGDMPLDGSHHCAIDWTKYIADGTMIMTNNNLIDSGIVFSKAIKDPTYFNKVRVKDMSYLISRLERYTAMTKTTYRLKEVA